MIQSPNRSVFRPLLTYIDRIERRSKLDVVTVIVPEFVPKRLWHHLLHPVSPSARINLHKSKRTAR